MQRQRLSSPAVHVKHGCAMHVTTGHRCPVARSPVPSCNSTVLHQVRGCTHVSTHALACRHSLRCAVHSIVSRHGIGSVQRRCCCAPTLLGAVGGTPDTWCYYITLLGALLWQSHSAGDGGRPGCAGRSRLRLTQRCPTDTVLREHDELMVCMHAGVTWLCHPVHPAQALPSHLQAAGGNALLAAMRCSRAHLCRPVRPVLTHVLVLTHVSVLTHVPCAARPRVPISRLRAVPLALSMLWQ